MSKLRVGIVFGGKSAEHEVSLQSAKNIIEAIDRDKFEVCLLGIDKQGQWHINDASNYLLNADNPELIALNRSDKKVALVPGAPAQQLIERDSSQALAQLDVIFPVMLYQSAGSGKTLFGASAIDRLSVSTRLLHHSFINRIG